MKIPCILCISRQRAFNWIVGVSFVLCAVIFALWAHSVRACDVIIQPNAQNEWLCITSEFGVLVFELQTPQRGQPRPGWVYFDAPLPRRFPGHWQWAGFDAYRHRMRHYLLLDPAPVYGLVIPHWFAAIATGILPLAWAVKWRRRVARARHTLAGRCAECGYDLRASIGRCPECGASIPTGANAVHDAYSTRPIPSL